MRPGEFNLNWATVPPDPLVDMHLHENRRHAGPSCERGRRGAPPAQLVKVQAKRARHMAKFLCEGERRSRAPNLLRQAVPSALMFSPGDVLAMPF